MKYSFYYTPKGFTYDIRILCLSIFEHSLESSCLPVLRFQLLNVINRASFSYSAIVGISLTSIQSPSQSSPIQYRRICLTPYNGSFHIQRRCWQVAIIVALTHKRNSTYSIPPLSPSFVCIYVLIARNTPTRQRSTCAHSVRSRPIIPSHPGCLSYGTFVLLSFSLPTT